MLSQNAILSPLTWLCLFAAARAIVPDCMHVFLLNSSLSSGTRYKLQYSIPSVQLSTSCSPGLGCPHSATLGQQPLLLVPALAWRRQTARRITDHRQHISVTPYTNRDRSVSQTFGLHGALSCCIYYPAMGRPVTSPACFQTKRRPLAAVMNVVTCTQVSAFGPLSDVPTWWQLLCCTLASFAHKNVTWSDRSKIHSAWVAQHADLLVADS